MSYGGWIDQLTTKNLYTSGLPIDVFSLLEIKKKIFMDFPTLFRWFLHCGHSKSLGAHHAGCCDEMLCQDLESRFWQCPKRWMLKSYSMNIVWQLVFVVFGLLHSYGNHHYSYVNHPQMGHGFHSYVSVLEYDQTI